MLKCHMPKRHPNILNYVQDAFTSYIIQVVIPKNFHCIFTLNESCWDNGFGSQTSLTSSLCPLSPDLGSLSSLMESTGRGRVVTFPEAGQEATLPEIVLTTTWVSTYYSVSLTLICFGNFFFILTILQGCILGWLLSIWCQNY